MKKNVGDKDRIIRITAGIVIATFGLAYSSLIALIVGILIMLTGFLGYCALYSLLGINTIKKDEDKNEYAQ